MDIQTASRVQRVKPSQTIVISDRAKALRAEGRDVIALSAGEPDFDTPPFIRQAAIAAIEQGQTRYTPVDGQADLKEAIIAKLQQDNALAYRSEQIIVSSGAKHSIHNTLQALLEPGDEVIVPAPYWVSYPDMVRLADGQPVIVPTTAASGFKLQPDALEAAISSRTRALMLNSPCNPTGAVYSAGELRALGEVIEAHPRLVVISDDIYERICWSTAHPATIAQVVPGLAARTVLINGVSKAYAMTGWRIGYAAGPAELIRAMKTLQSQSTSNPCSVSQAAATAALTGDQTCIDPMVSAYRARHDWLIPALNAIPGFHARPVDGTFYCFPDVSEAIARLGLEDDQAFAGYLLDRAGVALVPGSAFGGPGHVRISFATGLDALQEAVARLATVMERRPA